jgi:hypothetical protein
MCHFSGGQLTFIQDNGKMWHVFFFQEESYGNIIKMESSPFVRTEGVRFKCRGKYAGREMPN